MGDQWHPVSTAWTNSADLPEIPLTSEYYPASLSPGEIARSLIYTGNGSNYPIGTYTLRWSGNGTAQLTVPNLTVINSQPGQITYKVSVTNPNGIMLDITKTDPANPVRNIVVQAPFAGVNGRRIYRRV